MQALRTTRLVCETALDPGLPYYGHWVYQMQMKWGVPSTVLMRIRALFRPSTNGTEAEWRASFASCRRALRQCGAYARSSHTSKGTAEREKELFVPRWWSEAKGRARKGANVSMALYSEWLKPMADLWDNTTDPDEFEAFCRPAAQP